MSMDQSSTKIDSISAEEMKAAHWLTILPADDMGDLLGVSGQTVRRWGRHGVPEDKVQRVMDVIGDRIETVRKAKLPDGTIDMSILNLMPWNSQSIKHWSAVLNPRIKLSLEMHGSVLNDYETGNDGRITHRKICSGCSERMPMDDYEAAFQDHRVDEIARAVARSVEEDRKVVEGVYTKHDSTVLVQQYEPAPMESLRPLPGSKVYVASPLDDRSSGTSYIVTAESLREAGYKLSTDHHGEED